MYRIIFQLFLVLSIFLTYCGERKNNESNGSQQQISMDSVEKYNRGIVKSEEEEIEDFIARYGWKMNKTSTGLRYMIYHDGAGRKAEVGLIAICKYNVKLLTGKEIYNSDKNGLKEFRIGHGGIESGLEEGILLLKKGDKVKFIVPSRLAFGLLGDQNQIPPGATLVYNIELLNLKSNQ